MCKRIRPTHHLKIDPGLSEYTSQWYPIDTLEPDEIRPAKGPDDWQFGALHRDTDSRSKVPFLRGVSNGNRRSR